MTSDKARCNIDATDLYEEFDGNASVLLDEAIRQVEYHRDQLVYWRRLKAELEAAIPKDPIEELIEIGVAAWSR